MADASAFNTPPGPSHGKTATRAEAVFNRIRTAIVKGEIAPGAKIKEPQLAEQFGVSRGPLREAIRRLEGCRLVEVIPNAGARVIALSPQQLNEIYEIREALEGLACRLAAERATPTQVAQLRQLLAEHQQGIAAVDSTVYYQDEGSWDLHYQLLLISGNQRLFDLLCGELYHVMRIYRVQASSSPQRPEQALREHSQLVDAIANGDGELAELLMRRHISAARRELLAQFSAATPSGESE